MRAWLVLCASCHADPVVTAMPPLPPVEQPDAIAPLGSAIPIEKNEPHDTLTMERTACMGPCPLYRITVRDDGLVVYEGLGFVRQHGRATRHVSPELARSLIDEYRKVSAIPLKKPKIIVTTSDVPGVSFTFVAKDGTKSTLEHDTGDSRSPEEWTAFEDKLDEALRTRTWTSCGEMGCPR